MSNSVFRSLSCLAVSFLFISSAEAQSDADWKTINVNGLSEWGDPGKWWSEQDGLVVAESKGGKGLPRIHYLIWNGSLNGDFELELEYRIITDKPQDAGVNFKVERDKPMNEKLNLIGYQAELDTAVMYSKDKWIRQGKLFGHIHDGKRTRMFQRGTRWTIEEDGKESKSPLSKKFNPGKVFRKPPEWNTCRIRVEGDLIQLYLNGQLANEIVDRDTKMKSTGDAIALQFRPDGGYRFEVRNLRHREVK